jgi:hypothetical protein
MSLTISAFDEGVSAATTGMRMDDNPYQSAHRNTAIGMPAIHRLAMLTKRPSSTMIPIPGVPTLSSCLRVGASSSSQRIDIAATTLPTGPADAVSLACATVLRELLALRGDP